MISESQKQIVLDRVKALHPLKVGIFGSYARGENSPNSDLDILVYLDYSKKISLLDLIGIEQEISDALGIKVDLVTEKSLRNPYFVEELQEKRLLIYG